MIKDPKETRCNAAAESLRCGQELPETKLSDSDRILDLIAGSVDEVIFMFTSDWHKAIYFSPAYEKIWERPVDEIYCDARSWMNAVIPEDRGRVEAFIEGQVRGEIALENTIEYRIITPGGRVKWISSRTYPVRDEHGNLSRIAGISGEITSRKNYEEQLKGSEKFLNNIFDSFQDGISILDKDLNILRVNHVMEQWYSFRTPLKGRKCHEVFHGRAAACVKCPSIRAIENKVAESEIVPFQDESGRQIGWLDIHAYPLTDERNDVIGVIEHVRNVTDRMNAENALRESEEKYRSLVENINDMVWEVDGDFRITYASSRARDITGYDVEEIIGKQPFEFIVPADREKFGSLIDEAVRWKTPVELVGYRARRKDGRIIYLETNGMPVFNSDGSFRGYRGINRDITERKRAEEALKLTQFTMDRAGDMILWVTPDSHFVYVNEAACRTFGYTREEMHAMTAFDTCPSWTVESWTEHWKEIMERGSFTFEASLRRKDGSFFPGEISVYYLVYDGKEYNCSFIRDITERKRAEDALKESEEKFRVLAETMKAGIMLFQGTEMIYVNPALEQISEYGRDELLKMNYWELADQEHQEMMRSRGMARQQGVPEVPSTYEAKIRRKSGEVRWVELSVTLISYHGGQTCLATIFDITERKQWEDELHDAKAQAELYLDLMGHDINNLNQIGIGFLEVALSTLPLDRDSRELIARPLEAIEASSKLIANVRKLQKVREGGLKFKEIKIADRLKEIAPRYGDVPGRNIRISVDADCDCSVMANDLLDDVFSNIIHNAIKHSAGSLAVDVHLGMAWVGGRKYCLVAIEDDGPGIPDEQKGRLFSRSGHVNAKASGRGLGLHLVRTLVEDFRGKVWVEDRVNGDHTEGTRFVIMLPAIE